MMEAIVTDARYRMALAPIRCLARAGWNVTGVETDAIEEKKAICFYSKYLTDRRRLPEGSYEAALLELCREKSKGGEKPVIVPVGRRAMEALKSQQAADAADFLLPSSETLELADDKWRLYKLSEKLGIPAPYTTALSEHGSLEELADSAKYPSFIKFRNGELLGLKPVERYRIAKSPQELMAVYPVMAARDPDPIVQEYAPGRDVGIAAVMDRRGVMVDYMCYESLREYPVSGGPTCLCRTGESLKMVEYAKRLLSAIGYQGIAMLDFRGSMEDPKLLEINPRVWGSANICDVSGSSFFLSYARAARGEELPEADPERPGYGLGVTMRFSPQDAASMVSALRAGRPLLSTVGGYIRTALDSNIRNGVKLRGDMGPHRRYMMNLLKR